MSLEDLVIGPVAARLLACLDTQIQLLPKPPRNIGLRPGAAPPIGLSTTRDECCEGLAWVRLTGLGGSSTNNWPSLDVTPQGHCGVQMLALSFEIGIVRCAPTPPPNKMVSSSAWNEVAEDTYLDYIAMSRAICCFQSSHHRLTLLGNYVPLGVDGNCVGGTVDFTIATPPCGCVDLDSPS